MSNEMTQKKSLALAGIIIFIYNLVWINRFDFRLNIFTEESYVMMLVGLILIYPLFKDFLADRELRFGSETEGSPLLYLSEIIIYGSLFSLILYYFLIHWQFLLDRLWSKSGSQNFLFLWLCLLHLPCIGMSNAHQRSYSISAIIILSPQYLQFFGNQFKNAIISQIFFFITVL